MASILTIDLGTTFFKFALFGRDGVLRALHRVAPPLRRPDDGRCELDAGDFLQAVTGGIRQLGDRSPGGLADVAALGFATQTNSFLLVDEAGRPLTPLILWPDRRTEALPPEVGRLSELPTLRATTGVPRLASEFMVAKLAWLREHSPATWRRSRRVLLISDYLTWLCTGQYVTEGGAAGLTGLLDIHGLKWWPAALAALDLDEGFLARPARAGTGLGPLSAKAAERFGLPAGCRFVVGCLDQYAGAIGLGNVLPGRVSETTGTVLASIQLHDEFSSEPDPAVFQGPSFAEGWYYRMVFGEVAGNYLQWYRDQLPDRPDFDDLVAEAAEAPAGSEGLRLRTDVPLGDPATVFEGASGRPGRGHAVRCILETVAGVLREQVRVLSGGPLPREIRSAGGAARSELWLQIKADTLNAPFVATRCPEPTALGAAILAESALAGRPVPEIAEEWVQVRATYQPAASPR